MFIDGGGNSNESGGRGLVPVRFSRVRVTPKSVPNAAGRAPRRQECGGPERLEFGGGMPDTNCAKHIEQQTGEVELKNKIGLREAVV